MNTAEKKDRFIKVYRSRLDERLCYIQSLALSMGRCVEKTISSAKDIVAKRVSPEKHLPGMKEREKEINSLQLKLSKTCFRSLARQAPVAKDLRWILAFLSANTDLERMGDLAINIACKAQHLETHSSLNNSFLILEKMFNAAIEMVQLSLNSFEKENEQLANKVLNMDDIVDSAQKEITRESTTVMKQNGDLISTCIKLIIISGKVERIADHATNLAEEAIFLQTGSDVRHRRRKS